MAGPTVTAVLIGCGCLVAVAAAVRSTWSPCGVSMLSTITPLAERGRGHRFAVTATWFVAGATAGGATLGALAAGLAAAVAVIDPGTTTRALLAAAAAVVCLAADLRIAGFRLPGHGRQVDERWLDRYRPWVYAGGFGWQIGAGVTTYLMTAAVYLLVVVAALTGLPAVALAVGVLFGLLRGLAVTAGAGITSSARLVAFHRRFEAWRPASAVVAEAAEVVTLAAVVAVVSSLAGALVGAGATAVVAVVAVRRRRLAAGASAPVAQTAMPASRRSTVST